MCIHRMSDGETDYIVSMHPHVHMHMLLHMFLVVYHLQRSLHALGMYMCACRMSHATASTSQQHAAVLM